MNEKTTLDARELRRIEDQVRRHERGLAIARDRLERLCGRRVVGIPRAGRHDG